MATGLNRRRSWPGRDRNASTRPVAHPTATIQKQPEQPVRKPVPNGTTLASVQATFLYALGCSLFLSGSASAAAPTVDFNRDVLPILAEHCFACHGPDAQTRQADLRLDVASGPFHKLPSGKTPLVPGQLQASELFARVTTTDIDRRMPPPEAGTALSKTQQQVLQRWIEQGARWQTHWAYVPPQKTGLPAAQDTTQAIDHFVQARLRANDLQSAPPAKRSALLRRVCLNLTGLPPSLRQQARFLTDDSPDAYERLVDRLLTAPAFGEHQATGWLDLARYADTHGYHMDSHREMWRWRDWVIQALNHDMPFDQFTTEQIAGDLLPNATLEQRLATAFHRNTMINFENGAIPEEYLNEYVVDRVNTTATVWLGQTFRCARCHDHKYDPFTQRDFYGMYAFFHHVPEQGLDGNDGNAPPELATPTDLQATHMASLQAQLRELEKQLTRRAATAATHQQDWEKTLLAKGSSTTQVPGGMALHIDFAKPANEPIIDNVSGSKINLVGTRIQFPAKLGDCLLFDGSTHLEVPHMPALAPADAWSFSAWVFPTTRDRVTIAGRFESNDARRGYEIGLHDGRLTLRLAHRLPTDALSIRSVDQLKLSEWHHILVTSDGSGKANGIQCFIQGQPAAIETVQDQLTGTYKTAAPFRIGGRKDDHPFRGMLDEIRIYPRRITATEASLLAGANPIHALVAIPRAQRSAEQSRVLKQYYLEHVDEPYRRWLTQLRSVQRAERQLREAIPTTMVMSDAAPRKTYILDRGNYRFPGDEVNAALPSALSRSTRKQNNTRLDLARWLVARDNPLTARVTVNRFWQHHFGNGLVRTSEDFGTRGQRPSHPQLLDWLAVEFIESHWDIKQMHRRIVTSSTFRQRAGADTTVRTRDPDNRWLARGPRIPLAAETVRDNALAIAGLLDRRIGGPSVFTYQPAGLWRELSYNPNDYTAQQYQTSQGADLYRRGMYTFWKRAALTPSLKVFGAPNRETCVSRRSTSVTPMQSLALMNDPTFVEASRAFAQRIMLSNTTSDTARLTYAFRLAVCRPPTDREVTTLLQLLETQKKTYQRDLESANALLSHGDSAREPSLDAATHAAWTTIANVLLTLDEVLSNG